MPHSGVPHKPLIPLERENGDTLTESIGWYPMTWMGPGWVVEHLGKIKGEDYYIRDFYAEYPSEAALAQTRSNALLAFERAEERLK